MQWFRSRALIVFLFAVLVLMLMAGRFASGHTGTPDVRPAPARSQTGAR